jgi:hypothetical protein
MGKPRPTRSPRDLARGEHSPNLTATATVAPAQGAKPASQARHEDQPAARRTSAWRAVVERGALLHVQPRPVRSPSPRDGMHGSPADACSPGRLSLRNTSKSQYPLDFPNHAFVNHSALLGLAGSLERIPLTDSVRIAFKPPDHVAPGAISEWGMPEDASGENRGHFACLPENQVRNRCISDNPAERDRS